MIVTTHSPQETANLGPYLARSLPSGHVIALIGGLGSGKTVLAQTVARYLGVRRSVKSPTFILIAHHKTKKTGISSLFHVDCYRVQRLTESDRATIMEALETPRSVTLIEWADRIPSILARVPQQNLSTIRFEVLDARSRRLTFSGALTSSARKWATAHSS
jgi:tRNA threonylcarbamoyladenosine biosynthesis protein TsaE